MNGLSVSGQKVDRNLQIKNLNLKSKITSCTCYPCPSNKIRHSLESSKPEVFDKMC